MAETDVKASNAEKKVDHKCPDGYVEVWTWCFKKSVIDALTKPLENIKLPEFTDVSCEAALSALKTIEGTLTALMSLPSKYLGMLGSLLNYPFNIAQNMLNTINSAMDQVSKAIDNLVKGVADASGLTDLMNAMNSILGCSFLADSEIGKLAANIVDAVKSGMNVSSLLGPLKNMLNSTAKDALNNLKKTPTQAINNINNALNNLIKQLGLDDIVKNMKKLEKCVDSLCKAYSSLESFKDRLPSSAENIVKAGGYAWDSATQSLSSAAMSIAGQATGAVGSAVGAVTSVVSGNVASTVTGAITGTVSGAISSVKSGAASLVTSAVDSVTGGAASAVSGVVSTAKTAVGAVSNVGTAISTAKSGIASVASGTLVSNATSTLTGTIGGTAASVANGIQSAKSAVDSAVSSAISGLTGK